MVSPSSFVAFPSYFPRHSQPTPVFSLYEEQMATETLRNVRGNYFAVDRNKSRIIAGQKTGTGRVGSGVAGAAWYKIGTKAEIRCSVLPRESKLPSPFPPSTPALGIIRKLTFALHISTRRNFLGGRGGVTGVRGSTRGDRVPSRPKYKILLRVA